MNNETKYIASCSGGKDSVATLILAKQYGDPLDEVVYCEVMFDKDTSGEQPEHQKFIYEKVKPFVENQLGVPFTILRSERTYVDVFKHIITKGPNIGKAYGFAYPGMCAINRDCKIPPIRNYWKVNSENVSQYVGIAFDEQERLMRLQGTNQISLLAKYGYTERDATKLCVAHGMYSPIYEFSDRNGCWFCPNCKDREWAHLIFNHEAYFDRLITLENDFPHRARQCLTINETPSEIKNRILRFGEQCSLF
jgi:7-cyano-7-deazaguanine synthase in queuosine biosynthesis